LRSYNSDTEVMKNLHWHLFIAFLFLFLSSCFTDDEDEQDVIDKETISAKWVVSGTNQMFDSFEFFEDNQYLIVMNEPLKSTAEKAHLFGTYELTGPRTIRLPDFGTIKFQLKNSKDAVLEVKLEDDTEISMDVFKTDKISDSGKTKQLCRIWKREPYAGDLSWLKDYELKILFSHSGTYFVSLKDPENNTVGTLNFWKWKDDEETTICYSSQSSVICNGEYEWEILELKDNLLKVSHPDGFIESFYPTHTLN